MIAQAQSGTGKTATFSISVLQKIDTSLNSCQALILSPTRELALQVKHIPPPEKLEGEALDDLLPFFILLSKKALFFLKKIFIFKTKKVVRNVRSHFFTNPFLLLLHIYSEIVFFFLAFRCHTLYPQSFNNSIQLV